MAGKRFKTALKGIDRNKFYSVEDAVKLVKERAKAKFDETIEMAFNLGIDPKHADQNVRGVISLPHGTGKTVRVAVFAKGEKAEAAKKAGADIVGADDLAEKVQAGQMDFDRVIASPDMMVTVGKLGKVLGPRGLMPNPKLGTVTNDIAEAVKAAKGGQVEYRAQKEGIVHAGVGKASFSEQAPRGEREGPDQRGQPGEARRRQGHLHEEGVAEFHHGPRPEAGHRLGWRRARSG